MADFTTEVNKAQDSLVELNERMEKYINTLERANNLSLDFAKKKTGFGEDIRDADKLAGQFERELESVKSLYDEINNQTGNITDNMVNQFNRAFDRIVDNQKYKLTNALSMNDLSIKMGEHSNNKKIINDIMKALLPKNISMADTDIFSHLASDNGLGVFGLKKVELKGTDEENEKLKEEIRLLEEVNEGFEYRGNLYKIDKSIDMDEIHLETLKKMVEALKEYKELSKEVGSTSAINKMAENRLLMSNSTQIDTTRTNNKIANADSDVVVDSITVGTLHTKNGDVTLEQKYLPNNMEESLYERSANERLRGFIDEKGEHKGYEQIVAQENEVIEKLLEVLQTVGYVTQNISDAAGIVDSANFDGVIKAIVALNTNKDVNEVTDSDIMNPKNREMSLEKLENSHLAESVLELLQNRAQNEEALIKDYTIGDFSGVDLSSGTEEELTEKAKELVDKTKDASYDLIQRTVDTMDKYERTDASQYKLKTLTDTNKLRAQSKQQDELTGEEKSVVELARTASTQMNEVITAKENLKNLINEFGEAVKKGDLDKINGTGFDEFSGPIVSQISDAIIEYTQKAYGVLGGRFADSLSNMDKTGISTDMKYLFTEEIFNKSIEEFNKSLNSILDSQEYTELAQSFDNIENSAIKALADKNNNEAEKFRREAISKETKDFYREYLFNQNQGIVNQQRQTVIDSGVLGEKDTQAQIERLNQLNAQLEGSDERLQNIRDRLSENGAETDLVEQKAERLNEIYQEIRSGLDNSYYNADNFIKGLNVAISNGGTSIETIRNYLNSINSSLDPDNVLEYAKTLKSLGAFDVFNFGNYEKSILDNRQNTKGLKTGDLAVTQYNNRVWETLFKEITSNGFVSSGIEGLKNVGDMTESFSQLRGSIKSAAESINKLAESDYGKEHLLEMANLNSNLHSVSQQYENLETFLSNNDSAGAVKYVYDKAVSLGDTLQTLEAKIAQSINKQEEAIASKEYRENIEKLNEYLNYKVIQLRDFGREPTQAEYIQNLQAGANWAKSTFGEKSDEYTNILMKYYEAEKSLQKQIDEENELTQAAARHAEMEEKVAQATEGVRSLFKNKTSGEYEATDAERAKFANELDERFNKVFEGKTDKGATTRTFDFSEYDDAKLQKYNSILTDIVNKERERGNFDNLTKETMLIAAISTELAAREQIRKFDAELVDLENRRAVLMEEINKRKAPTMSQSEELNKINDRINQLNIYLQNKNEFIEKEKQEKAAVEATTQAIHKKQEEYVRSQSNAKLSEALNKINSKDSLTENEQRYKGIIEDELNQRRQSASEEQKIEDELAAQLKKYQDEKKAQLEEVKNKVNEVVSTVKNAVHNVINIIQKANDVLNKSFKFLISAFNTIEDTIKRIIKLFGNFGNALGKLFKDNNKSTNLLKGSWTELKSAIDLVSGAFNKLVNNDLVKESKKLIGSINYLSVVIGNDLTRSTVEWAEEMENVLGMDAAQLINQLSQVESELYALGMSTKNIATAGKGLVTEANVISAITGMETSNAINKLNMGMRGMSRSLAELGIYANNNEINRYLKNLQAQGGEYANITTNINNLTEAQKSYVRYYVLMDKLMKTYTPERYAKSLETLTGRLYILNNQLAIMKQNLANFFGALLNKALMPIIGAILKLNEFINFILGKIAALLHLDWKPIENSMAKSGDEGKKGAEGIDDMSDALDDMSDAADKAKGSLDSLDHVSTMSESKNKGSNFDYSKLMDLVDMSDYYDQMEKLNSDFLDRCRKAWEEVINAIKAKIKEAIMSFEEFIGRIIDWDFIKSNLYGAWVNIKNTFKNIVEIAKNALKIIGGLLWSIGDDLDFSRLIFKFTKAFERLTKLVAVILDKIGKPIMDMYNKYLSPYVERLGNWIEDKLDELIAYFNNMIGWWEDPRNKKAIDDWFDNLGRHIKAIIMIIEALFQGGDRKMHLDEVGILDGEGMEGFKKAYEIAGNIHDVIGGLIVAFKELFGIDKDINDVERQNKTPDTVKSLIGLCTTLHIILRDVWDVIKGVLQNVLDFNKDGVLNWDDMKTALDFIKGKLDRVAEWLETNKEPIITLLSTAAETVGKIGEAKFDILMTVLEFITDNAETINNVLLTLQSVIDFVAKNPLLSTGIYIGVNIAGNVIKTAATAALWSSILGTSTIPEVFAGVAAAITGPIGIIIGILVAAVTWFTILWNKSEWFKTTITNGIEEIKQHWEESWAAISGDLDEITGGLDSVRETLSDLGIDLDDLFWNDLIQLLYKDTIRGQIELVKIGLDSLLWPLRNIISTLSGIVGLARNVKQLFTDISNIDLGNVVTNIAKVNGGVAGWIAGKFEGKTTKIKGLGYANGGVPSSGSIFFANENGNTELVGNFGGYSGVANQSMIIEAMQNAMVQAIRSAGGTGNGGTTVNNFNIGNWLGDDASIRKLANRLNTVNAKSNSNIANVGFVMS